MKGPHTKHHHHHHRRRRSKREKSTQLPCSRRVGLPHGDQYRNIILVVQFRNSQIRSRYRRQGLLPPLPRRPRRRLTGRSRTERPCSRTASPSACEPKNKQPEYTAATKQARASENGWGAYCETSLHTHNTRTAVCNDSEGGAEERERTTAYTCGVIFGRETSKPCRLVLLLLCARHLSAP